MATAVRRMLEGKVEAVAIMTSEMDRSFTQELAGRDIPMVFLDVGTVEKHISNIKVDYASGISQAVEHLIGLGHRRVAFIGGPADLKSARIRQSAFLKAMQKRGMGDPAWIETGHHLLDCGVHGISRVLARAPRRSALRFS